MQERYIGKREPRLKKKKKKCATLGTHASVDKQKGGRIGILDRHWAKAYYVYMQTNRNDNKNSKKKNY